MKLAAWFIAIMLWLIFWLYVFASDFRTYAKAAPVIVPYCYAPNPGWYLPCSDVDRYEYI